MNITKLNKQKIPSTASEAEKTAPANMMINDDNSSLCIKLLSIPLSFLVCGGKYGTFFFLASQIKKILFLNLNFSHNIFCVCVVERGRNYT